MATNALSCVATVVFLSACAVASPGDEDTEPTGVAESAVGSATNSCYGAHGANCDGIPLNNTLLPIAQGGNIYSLPVTVGSQYHDRCCSQVLAAGGRGYMCNGGNTDTSTCQAEFNRAVDNQAWGYTWRQNFDVSVSTPYSQNADLANIKAPSGTKLSVSDARAGWCANGWYYINFYQQAKCK